MAPSATTQLTVAVSTALARAIRVQTGVIPGIKWPNDILIGGKKVAGILTELSAELDHVKYVILGIGVDVNITAAEFPADLRKIATSLKIESRQHINRADLAAAILRELDADYARICSGQFERVADEWQRQCITVGRNVTVHIGDRVLHGVAESLDNDGALLLRTQHGRLERIVGGDVMLEKNESTGSVS
jgi:BirA family biotin operon repressor/biotin-[acetyl-CoA-carboxylase] ligase